MGFTGFSWIIIGFNEFYWVFLGPEWVLPSFYRVLPSFTRHERASKS